jgi:hypothetical protein
MVSKISAEPFVGFAPALLAADARRLAGVSPDEPLQYLDGLEKLASAVDAQAQLTDAGRMQTRAALVKAIATQLHVRCLLAGNPAISQIPVRPVVITGLLRTGTTFLQHLLAQHPDLRSPALWELMAPADPGEPVELIAECERYIEEYYQAAPRFKAIHSLDARLPEECHRLTANTFRDPIYTLRYRVPDYADWLSGQSMVPSYEFHLAQLRCILSRQPGNPVVLKCPSHLWYLDALGEVYPTAKIIRMHRSPADAVPSVCSLTAVVRAARARDVDKKEIGQYWFEQAKTALCALRQGTGPTCVPPLDLRYIDLVADPIGVAALVCDYIGVPLTEQSHRRMSNFIANHAGDSTGSHRYSADEFGLQPQQLEKQFADYITEFDLASDPENRRAK